MAEYRDERRRLRAVYERLGSVPNTDVEAQDLSSEP